MRRLTDRELRAARILAEEIGDTKSARAIQRKREQGALEQ